MTNFMQLRNLSVSENLHELYYRWNIQSKLRFSEASFFMTLSYTFLLWSFMSHDYM